MALIYTTVAAINARLQTRLQVGGTYQTLGKTVVDTAQLQEWAEQAEARMNAKLGKFYLLPLKLSSPDTVKILASIAEKMTICDVLPIYFLGVGPSDEGGKYEDITCKQAKEELDTVLSIPLEGEFLNPEPNNTTPNFSQAARRDVSPADCIWWGSDQPQGYGFNRYGGVGDRSGRRPRWPGQGGQGWGY